MLFGASMLSSVLPLLIVLSSLADQKIDDDLSRHIGLDKDGAEIIRGLFRSTPTHDAGAIVTAVIFGLAGTLVTVSFLQTLYERAFEQAPRGWRDIGRFLVWVAVLAAVLVAGGLARSGLDIVLVRVVSLVLGTAFFWWSMHFLLAGRVAWRALARPALLTGIFWVGLSIFASAVFSSTIVSDSRLYGTVGVVFTLLTWFIAIGAVVVLGAVAGATWEARRGASRRASG